MSEQKPQITCHVLDASLGKPAAGIDVQLQEHRQAEGGAFIFTEIANGITNADGRCTDLLSTPSRLKLTPGIYKIIFRTKEYFDRSSRPSFYPWVEVLFELQGDQHYHIPLLISPFSYTTYRGT